MSKERIFEVSVIPNSRKREIRKEGDIYVAKVKSPAERGRANLELLKLLSEKFKVPLSDIMISKGRASRKKIVKIKFDEAGVIEL